MAPSTFSDEVTYYQVCGLFSLPGGGTSIFAVSRELQTLELAQEALEALRAAYPYARIHRSAWCFNTDQEAAEFREYLATNLPFDAPSQILASWQHRNSTDVAVVGSKLVLNAI